MANREGKIINPGQKANGGGYAGCFADPVGFLWEVAWKLDFPHV